MCFSACPSPHQKAPQFVSMRSSVASGAPPSEAEGRGLEGASSSLR